MNLKLESRDGIVLATATGQLVSLSEALEHCKDICDAAAEKGYPKILFDCLAVEGELSVLERYQLGKTIAEYCRSGSINPAVAIIGKPPAVTGFGAEVASNRGLLVVTFLERQAGLDWLIGFGSKATAT
jgi:hypothetical protein